jgi:hypothetical protein
MIPLLSPAINYPILFGFQLIPYPGTSQGIIIYLHLSFLFVPTLFFNFYKLELKSNILIYPLLKPSSFQKATIGEWFNDLNLLISKVV